MLPNFVYVRANTVKEALKSLGSGEAVLHAGGTDLLGCLRDHVFTTDKVVSVSQVKDLKGIEGTKDGGLYLKALTTIADIASDKLVNRDYPALAQAASEVASPQLRNQGTIGGNICQKPRCWYYRGDFNCLRKGGGTCFAAKGENHFHAIFGSDGICWYVHPSDAAPALMALSAEVHIMGPKGRRKVPIEKFFVRPKEDVEKETILNKGEIVISVRLPKPHKGLKSSYRKVRTRHSWDFALAGVALALKFKGDTVEQARVVLSGVAPIPWRSKGVEQAIIGKKLTRDVISKAAQAATKGAKPLEHNGYKVHLVQGLIEEELAKIT